MFREDGHSLYLCKLSKQHVGEIHNTDVLSLYILLEQESLCLFFILFCK